MDEKSEKTKAAKPAEKKCSLFCVNDKRNIICGVIAAVIMIGLFLAGSMLSEKTSREKEHITVGLIYDGDESTPYSANFIRAARQLEKTYGDRIDLIEKYNVPYDDTEKVIDELASEKCDIIFTNSYEYGETAKQMARKYPSIEFCEATCDNANKDPIEPNYHNFMGKIYQGRYISGVAAGAKLSEMIQNGTIDEDEAVLGFVAAYPCAEVVSGYTAFLLGARSQCPSAVMKVKYINTWTSFSLEKQAAEQLISEGCVIISHHSNTIGSAIACENEDMSHPVYHVGYNQDMIDIAPTSALVSCRIEWTPYFISAVEAVLAGEPIEQHIDGSINGNDASGGFKEGWVKLLELNRAITSEYTKALLDKAVDDMIKGKTHVFSGNYKGTSIDDPNDRCDLTTEYIENSKSSAPTFNYLLDDIITIVE